MVNPKKASVTKDSFRVHDLGYKLASIVFNSGEATLYDIQHLLGHQSPQTELDMFI